MRGETRGGAVAGLLAIAACISGCTTYVVSPPAEYAGLETPGSRPAGTNSVALEGTFVSEVFGISLTSQSVRARRALPYDLEVSESIFHAYVLPDGDWAGSANLSQSIVGGRVALKWGPERYIGLIGALGGGFSEFGGFIAPEIGITLGWENPWVTPIVSGRIGASLPVASDTILLPEDSDTGAPLIPFTPDITASFSGVVGFRTILHRYRADQRHRGYLSIAALFTGLLDSEDAYGYYGFAASFELEIAPRP